MRDADAWMWGYDVQAFVLFFYATPSTICKGIGISVTALPEEAVLDVEPQVTERQGSRHDGPCQYPHRIANIHSRVTVRTKLSQA
jgi:hypothetical protein